MDILLIKDVKAHEIHRVIDAIQGKKQALIEAGETDAEMVVPSGPRQLAARPGDVGAEQAIDSADERRRSRPVNVTVNVTANGGGREPRNAERGAGKSGDGDSRAEAQKRRDTGKTLAAIRKKTDLIPGLVEKVDATPRRTAALVKDARRGERVASAAPDGRGDSGTSQARLSERGRAQKVRAGRGRSVVRNRRDRAAIRAAVLRLIAQGFSQKAACEEVADEARKGRAGGRVLTAKYDVGEFEATATVVRRILRSRW